MALRDATQWGVLDHESEVVAPRMLASTDTMFVCRYVMSPGHSLVDVAGMFETNWVQLWSLNPTLHTPDSRAVNSTMINVGHKYVVSQTMIQTPLRTSW